MRKSCDPSIHFFSSCSKKQSKPTSRLRRAGRANKGIDFQCLILNSRVVAHASPNEGEPPFLLVSYILNFPSHPTILNFARYPNVLNCAGGRGNGGRDGVQNHANSATGRFETFNLHRIKSYRTRQGMINFFSNHPNQSALLTIGWQNKVQSAITSKDLLHN